MRCHAASIVVGRTGHVGPSSVVAAYVRTCYTVRFWKVEMPVPACGSGRSRGRPQTAVVTCKNGLTSSPQGDELSARPSSRLAALASLHGKAAVRHPAHCKADSLDIRARMTGVSTCEAENWGCALLLVARSRSLVRKPDASSCGRGGSLPFARSLTHLFLRWKRVVALLESLSRPVD